MVERAMCWTGMDGGRLKRNRQKIASHAADFCELSENRGYVALNVCHHHIYASIGFCILLVANLLLSACQCK